MKILLLTDVPPCKDFSGALVLDRLCRLLPKGVLACATTLHSSLSHIKISPDLDVPTLYLRKPSEGAALGIRRRVRFPRLAELLGYGYEWVQAAYVRFVLVPRIVAFARAQKVDRVWAVLQGQTMIRAAIPVAKKLGVPLYTQVWDPLGWWLRANAVDGRSAKRLHAQFDDVIRASTCCATASWAMSQAYEQRYGIRTQPVIASFDTSLAIAPRERPSTDSFTIGIAGQFYAAQEWKALINALDQVGWMLDGRQVKMRVLSGNFQHNAAGQPCWIEYLGWRPQEDVLRLLSACDVLYLPYWFDPVFREEASLSFPSKLVSYMAAGRPVLFHGPEYASPARYLAQHQAGELCHSLEAADILASLARLSEPAYGHAMAMRAQKAFHRDFTLERMKETFHGFLDIA